ncbi:cache domain-containing sensor histidine kinase [Paenibacillus sp. CAU 1782]
MKRKLFGFSNLSIRYKLFISLLLIVTIPFLLLLYIHVATTQKESAEAAIYSSQKILGETKSYLEYKSQAITEVLNFIAFNSFVQTHVSSESSQYEDVNVWHMEALQLSRLINQFRYNDEIDSIQVLMRHGLAEATENNDFLRMDRYESEAWYKSFEASSAAFAWMPSSVIDGEAAGKELTILRKVPNAHNIKQFDGIIRARLNASAMDSVLDHSIVTPNASAFLYNEQGQLLGQADTEQEAVPSIQDVAILQTTASSGSVFFDDNYTLDGKRHLLGVQPVPNTPMLLALIVPYSDILESSTKARNRIISIFLLVVPLTLPLSFYVAGSATKRIRGLILHVRKVKNGKFQVAPLSANEDEIGELTHNFNVMVQNMSNLMNETYTLGRELKNKELKALQAQINPHFLYNTLDLINVMAIESGSNDIKRVVDELAVFYKLSLSNGKEYVTLKNELQHIEAYVRIQNMRFGDGIQLITEVPRELHDRELPKILLQPLVENAILHGIMEKDSEKGIVVISAWEDRGDMVIEVKDDGVGMDETSLAAIFTGYSGKSNGGGYGVRNIEERLKLSYGPMYGMVFESKLGEGTRVMLRVPEQLTGVERALS